MPRSRMTANTRTNFMVTRRAAREARENQDASIIIIEDSSGEDSPIQLGQISTANTLATTISASSTMSDFDSVSASFGYPPYQSSPMPDGISLSSTLVNPYQPDRVSMSSTSTIVNGRDYTISSISSRSSNVTSKSSCNHPCPICLRTVIGKKPHCIPCGHVYCMSCMNKFVDREIKHCAICKKSFQENGIREIFL